MVQGGGKSPIVWMEILIPFSDMTNRNVPYTISTKSFNPDIIDFFDVNVRVCRVYMFMKLRLWERRTVLLLSYATNVISYSLTSIHIQIFEEVWYMIVMCMVSMCFQGMGSLETRQGRWTFITSLRMCAQGTHRASSLWSGATGSKSKKLVHKQF